MLPCLRGLEFLLQLEFLRTTHATHGADKLCMLTNHYGQYGDIDTEDSQVELNTLNSVVASNVELKRMSVHQLMSHLVKSEELKLMFPNLAKLAAIGLLLPMSTVDCERGFSAFTRVKSNLRNRLSAKTLNHLLVITTEGPISPTDHFYDQACDLWASW